MHRLILKLYNQREKGNKDYLRILIFMLFINRFHLIRSNMENCSVSDVLYFIGFYNLKTVVGLKAILGK